MSSLKEFTKEVAKLAGIEPVKLEKKDDTVTYSKLCSVTKELYSVTISVSQYLAHNSGQHIQNVFTSQ